MLADSKILKYSLLVSFEFLDITQNYLFLYCESRTVSTLYRAPLVECSSIKFRKLIPIDFDRRLNSDEVEPSLSRT